MFRPTGPNRPTGPSKNKMIKPKDFKMKKIFAASMFAALALSAFAATESEYKFPGFLCKDAAKFAASAAIAPQLPQKCRDTVLLRMIRQPVTSFAEFAALVDSVADELKGDADPNKVAALKILLKKQIPYVKNIWIADAWKFCQANPTAYDVNYVISRAKVIGMTDAQTYAWLINYLLTSRAPERVELIVDKLIDLAPGLTGIDAKADFQKLNRRFSKNLLKDKKMWEPIIAKIRTTIETY